MIPTPASPPGPSDRPRGGARFRLRPATGRSSALAPAPGLAPGLAPALALAVAGTLGLCALAPRAACAAGLAARTPEETGGSGEPQGHGESGEAGESGETRDSAETRESGEVAPDPADDARAAAPPGARLRVQAFLLPLDEASRPAAVRVAAGTTAALLRSTDELVDLAAPLAAAGPAGAASLSALVARAAAEADRGDFGPAFRALAARFSLDRVLVGSVALAGSSVRVRLSLGDARLPRLAGQQTLSLPSAAASFEPSLEAALRGLSAPPAGPGPAVQSNPAPAEPDLAAPPRPAPTARHAWKRGLLDKTGTEGWGPTDPG